MFFLRIALPILLLVFCFQREIVAQEVDDYIYCEPENCYDVLGVDTKASTQEIRRKYRSLSKKWHPDRNKSPEAAERFRVIALANEVSYNLEQELLVYFLVFYRYCQVKMRGQSMIITWHTQKKHSIIR